MRLDNLLKMNLIGNKNRDVKHNEYEWGSGWASCSSEITAQISLPNLRYLFVGDGQD